MLRILAVDDDPSTLKLIELVLRNEGFVVQTFTDAVEALAYMKDLTEEPPHLILSDMRMPAMSGFEFLQTLRQHSLLSHVPFLFLSSYAELNDIRMGMRLGADDYVPKPFQPQELIESVRVRLERAMELRKPLEVMPETDLRVQGLGLTKVFYQGTEVLWSTKKAQELFFYLLEKGSSGSWEIAEALWPDKDEERASSLFHTTLHRLRKSLSADTIDLSNRRYGISEKVTVAYDVAKYRQGAAEVLSNGYLKNLDDLMGQYSPFLQDFHSEWCGHVRQELSGLQVQLLEVAARIRSQAQQATKAIEFLQQAIELDPFREESWKLLQGLLDGLSDPRSDLANKRIPWWLEHHDLK